MASYFRAWFYGTTTPSDEAESTTDTPSSSLPEVTSPQTSNLPASTSPVEPPVAVSISTPEETQEAIGEDREDLDDDTPPAFPSLNSIQRSSVSTPTKATVQTDEGLMPPPALPTRLVSPSGVANASSTHLSTPNRPNYTSSLLPPPTANTLRIPSATGTSSNTLKLPPSTTRAPASAKRRGKVALAPGHSPLDWAALKASGEDLRGTPGLMRVTPSQLKMHNKRDDAWSSFNGKVYNITPYLSFHPGGEKELMRVAGRDGTKLFALTHAWVNVEFMLDECMVGFLIPEPSSAA